VVKRTITGKESIKGLILAGGRSSRLGINKAFLTIRGETQISYLSKQFSNLNIPVFVSVKKVSEEKFRDFNLIIDTGTMEGPLAGIHSAFDFELATWIVIAVDMPFITSSVIRYLMENRNPDCDANSFTLDGNRPEPMITIWEKSSKEKLDTYINKGGSSPIQFLQANNTNLIPLPNPDWVRNINNEKDMEEIKTKLRSIHP